MKKIKHLYYAGSMYYAGSNIMLECELEYDPGEPANTDPESGTCGPAWPPVAYLITAKIGNLDVMPILDPAIIEQIEVGACSMQA